MLFAVLGAAKPGSLKERIERRMKWSYPEGTVIVAEYWLQTPDPSLITLVETDSLAPIMAAIMAWDDVFSFKVVPAVTAQQGLEIVKQMR